MKNSICLFIFTAIYQVEYSYQVQDLTFTCIFSSRTCQDFKSCCSKFCNSSPSTSDAFCLDDQNGTLARLPETRCTCESSPSSSSSTTFTSTSRTESYSTPSTEDITTNVYELEENVNQNCRLVAGNRCDLFAACCDRQCPNDEFPANFCVETPDFGNTLFRNFSVPRKLTPISSRCYCVSNFRAPLTFDLYPPFNGQPQLIDRTEICLRRNDDEQSCNNFATCCRNVCEFGQVKDMCVSSKENLRLRSTLTFCRCTETQNNGVTQNYGNYVYHSTLYILIVLCKVFYY